MFASPIHRTAAHAFLFSVAFALCVFTNFPWILWVAKVGHGADKEYQPQAWMHGSQVYMARTTQEVSPETMSDGKYWEYFGGYSGSNHSLPTWVPDVADAAPLFTWENKTGVVTLTYVSSLRRFVMVVGTPTNPSGVGSMEGTFDTYFLESTAITGPFRMVTYLKEFGPQAYFANIPSK